MDDKLLVALVAGVAALLGSLIPTVVGYLNNKSQREFEIKRTLLEKQRQAYSDVMESLQRMVNAAASRTSGPDPFELQRPILQVAIYGDDNTTAAVNDYYNALVGSAQPGGSPLQAVQHQSHQRRIANAMRASVGLQPMASFALVGMGAADGVHRS